MVLRAQKLTPPKNLLRDEHLAAADFHLKCGHSTIPGLVYRGLQQLPRAQEWVCQLVQCCPEVAQHFHFLGLQIMKAT